MSQIQVIFSVVALALLAIVGVSWRPSNAHQAAYTARDLSSVLMSANSIASAAADGGTVYFTPSAGGTLVTVYQGRPDLTSTPPTSDHYPIPVPVTLSDGTSSFGLVLARDGSASLLTGWSPWTPITAAPAACVTVALLVGRPGATRSATLSCDTLSLQ